MRKFIALTMAALLFLGCCGCGGNAPLTRTATMLDTVVNVSLYDKQDEALLDECMDVIAAREALWSRTVEGSDIARLNAAAGQTVAVADETAALLQTAQMYTDLTGGAFDVTVAPLLDLWDEATKTGVEPTEDALAAACAAVNSGGMSIGESDVTLASGMAVDLGGIAKGAIADELASLLAERGCQSALIDLGGNVLAVGSRPDGSPFRVGISDPRDPDSVIAKVEVSSCSVVTSGSYSRRYFVGDREYSHILDPRTGQPVQNDLLSVTILSPQSIDGDALSTACFVMGLENAQALVESFSDVEAVFVKADGTVVATDGVKLVP
ncbi:MAG: FAD:protein FMN transferase [Clostridia bacterium]|nr:FAD:protein FMN transferase [Clostridia bacterium]